VTLLEPGPRRWRTADLVDNQWRLSPDRLGAALDKSYLRPKHIRYLGDRIAQTIAQGNGRLIINLPPRHGKSWLIGTWTPTWFLHHRPDGRVLLTTHADSLAVRSGRAVRRNVLRYGDRLGLKLASDVARSNEWETTEGGGMWTAPIGGQMTGLGGDLIIIDDPHSDWAAAQSAAEKAAVWDFYTAVMRIRAQPGATIIVLHTRWVPDDLAGRLMAHSQAGTGEHWDRIRLPALAYDPHAARAPVDIEEDADSELEDFEADPLGREPGEALWPEEWPAAEIEAIRLVQTKVQFSGLMQQNPTVAEGEVFLRENWGRVDALPAVPVVAPLSGRRGVLMVRRWDLAATVPESGNDPDWTVGALCALDETSHQFFIVDIMRGRWSSGQVRNVIRDTAETDAARWGQANVLIRGEAEGGSSGKTVKEEWEDELLGYPARWVASTGKKEVRAEGVLAAHQNHRVYLVRRLLPDGYGHAPWWPDLIEEFADFPSAKVHDDQVDAVSQAFNDLTEIARARRKRKTQVRSVAGQTIGSGRAVGILPPGRR
jgi:predicted phage terminase large subunit-like protein